MPSTASSASGDSEEVPSSSGTKVPIKDFTFRLSSDPVMIERNPNTGTSIATIRPAWESQQPMAEDGTTETDYSIMYFRHPLSQKEEEEVRKIYREGFSAASEDLKNATQLAVASVHRSLVMPKKLQDELHRTAAEKLGTRCWDQLELPILELDLGFSKKSITQDTVRDEAITEIQRSLALMRSSGKQLGAEALKRMEENAMALVRDLDLARKTTVSKSRPVDWSEFLYNAASSSLRHNQWSMKHGTPEEQSRVTTQVDWVVATAPAEFEGSRIFKAPMEQGRDPGRDEATHLRIRSGPSLDTGSAVSIPDLPPTYVLLPKRDSKGSTSVD